jgi:hypothetical protein
MEAVRPGGPDAGSGRRGQHLPESRTGMEGISAEVGGGWGLCKDETEALEL